MTAHYGGDQQFSQSDSSAVAVNISPEASSTAFSVSYYNRTTNNNFVAGAAFPYGSLTLVSAAVAGASGFGVATGAVTLTDNGSALDGEQFALNSQGVAEKITKNLLPGGAIR